MKTFKCQVCNESPSKYSCPSCLISYCSVACYKGHKAVSCASGVATTPQEPIASLETAAMKPIVSTSTSLSDPKPLRPLASLRWPYVPEEPSHPDPLATQEIRPLQLPQYESIAASPRVRQVFTDNPRLKQLLRGIDSLQGEDRESELERVLGVGLAGSAQTHDANDMAALRELAETIEEAVRTTNSDSHVGLDWEAR